MRQLTVTPRVRGLVVALLISIVWLWAVRPAEAQTQSSGANGAGSGRIGVLTDFDFHLNMAHMGEDDVGFRWDADFGGDIDLLDYGHGRINFLANYETIVGEEFRRFDPTQGNYTLDISASWRLDDVEVAGTLHHVSRHLSDRAKRFPIDWNMLGFQVSKPFTLGRTAVETHGRALWTINRSFVDYRAEYGAGLRLRHPVGFRLSGIAAGEFNVMPVASEILGRPTQAGIWLEGGVRVQGSSAAAEFFVAFERRIDASPFDVMARKWTLVGFRLVRR